MTEKTLLDIADERSVGESPLLYVSYNESERLFGVDSDYHSAYYGARKGNALGVSWYGGFDAMDKGERLIGIDSAHYGAGGGKINNGNTIEEISHLFLIPDPTISNRDYMMKLEKENKSLKNAIADWRKLNDALERQAAQQKAYIAHLEQENRDMKGEADLWHKCCRDLEVEDKRLHEVIKTTEGAVQYWKEKYKEYKSLILRKPDPIKDIPVMTHSPLHHAIRANSTQRIGLLTDL